jgi:hypothetical protein
VTKLHVNRLISSSISRVAAAAIKVALLILCLHIVRHFLTKFHEVKSIIPKVIADFTNVGHLRFSKIALLNLFCLKVFLLGSC